MRFIKKIAKGFTLIEVLVAIAVIGFTVPSVMLLMIKQTDYTSVLRDRTIASWAAQNKLAEIRHNRLFLNELPERETIEKIDMAGREWTIDMDISKAEIWVKYTVKVIAGFDDDESLITLETYLHD